MRWDLWNRGSVRWNWGTEGGMKMINKTEQFRDSHSLPLGWSNAKWCQSGAESWCLHTSIPWNKSQLYCFQYYISVGLWGRKQALKDGYMFSEGEQQKSSDWNMCTTLHLERLAHIWNIQTKVTTYCLQTQHLVVEVGYNCTLYIAAPQFVKFHPNVFSLVKASIKPYRRKYIFYSSGPTLMH